MKVIDLLNKIANNEELPKKIVFDNYTFEYDEGHKNYYKTGNSTFSFFRALFDYNFCILNEEVEVLEDKKIPTLKNLNLTKIDINKEGQVYGATKKEMIADIQTLQNWINKIIDKMNKE